jgi:short-subunit dehydrogenase
MRLFLKVEICSLDVGQNVEAVQKGIDAAVKKAEKPIDVLINCAGKSEPGTFDELDSGAFKKMMDVNYFGSVGYWILFSFMLYRFVYLHTI